MRDRIHSRIGVLVSSAALTLLPAVAPAQAPVFSSRTELVVVDAVVTDPAGVPVGGLNREDFRVLEDGRPVELSSFEAVSLPASRLAPPRPGRSPLLPAPAVSVPPQPRGLMIVVFDELHLGRAEAERAKQELRAGLAEPSLGALDVVLLSTAGGGGWSARVPEDGEQIDAALGRFRGLARSQAGGRMTDQEAFLIAVRRERVVETQVYRRYLDFGLLPDPTLGRPGRQRRSGGSSTLVGGEDVPAIHKGVIRAEAEELRRESRARQIATLDGLRRILDSLVERPGRKALVLVSHGFVRDPSIADERGLTEAARRAKATLHLLDARDGFAGLPTHDVASGAPVDLRDVGDTLTRLASQAEAAEAAALATGGRVVHGARHATDALRRIGSELRTYYLLGYAPPPDARGDGYRHIEVSVDRPGLKVLARPGYYPGGDAAAVTPVPPESVLDGGEIPVRLEAFVVESLNGGHSRVRVVGEADLPTRAGTADVAFELVARDRPRSYRSAARATLAGDAPGPLRSEATFDAEPGVYQAWFGVRVEGAGQAGGTRRLVEVPEQSGLRISTPILTDVLLGTAPDLRPTLRADRRFTADATLFVAFEVLGHAAAETISAGFEVHSARGELVRRGASSPLAGGRLSRLWAIPLEGLPPGPYRLVVQVEGSKSTRSASVPEDFEIVPTAAPE